MILLSIYLFSDKLVCFNDFSMLLFLKNDNNQVIFIIEMENIGSNMPGILRTETLVNLHLFKGEITGPDLRNLINITHPVVRRKRGKA
jgi:hypothetical protein